MKLRHALCLAPLVACSDDPSTTVKVSAGDAARLEAIVADPAYADHTIELAAGTYALTKTLVLQPGQRLVGQNSYVDHDGDGVSDPVDASKDPADITAAYVVSGETILDGTHRDGSSVVVMNTNTRLEGVTVRGAGRAVESADVFGDLRYLVLIEADGASVSNTLIEHGYHGLGFGPGATTGSFRATVDDNVIRDTGEGLVAYGIKDGADLVMALDFNANRVAGGLFQGEDGSGIGLVVSFSGERNRLDLTSRGNIIEKNGQVGVYMAAAFSFGFISEDIPVAASSHDNTVTWRSVGDRVWRNGNPAAPTVYGGMSLQAVFDRNAAASSSGNSLVITLEDTQLVKPGAPRSEQNMNRDAPTLPPYRVDMGIVGANFPGCTGHGDGNTVSITFDGVTSDNADTDNPCTNDLCTSIYGFDNFIGGEGDNSIRLTPADPAAFEAANPGLEAPLHAPAIIPSCTPPAE